MGGGGVRCVGRGRAGGGERVGASGRGRAGGGERVGASGTHLLQDPDGLQLLAVVGDDLLVRDQALGDERTLLLQQALLVQVAHLSPLARLLVPVRHVPVGRTGGRAGFGRGSGRAGLWAGLVSASRAGAARCRHHKPQRRRGRGAAGPRGRGRGRGGGGGGGGAPEVDGLEALCVDVPLLLPDGELHELVLVEDLLLARHPVEARVLRHLLLARVRRAVEHLRERLLVGADLVRCDELERAQRHLVGVVVGDDVLAQPDRVVRLRREVEALHLLRHQRDERLLLIVTVDVVELDLNVRRRRQRILVEILLRACGCRLV